MTAIRRSDPASESWLSGQDAATASKQGTLPGVLVGRARVDDARGTCRLRGTRRLALGTSGHERNRTRTSCDAPHGLYLGAVHTAGARADAAGARSAAKPLPAVRAGDGAQSDQRVHVRPRPMPAAAFQPRLDHQLVGALNTAAADREVLRLEGGVLDLSRCLAAARPS